MFGCDPRNEVVPHPVTVARTPSKFSVAEGRQIVPTALENVTGLARVMIAKSLSEVSLLYSG